VELLPAAGGPSPDADAVEDVWILPVADDRGPAAPEPSLEIPELAVAMGRLIEVHEVHVDLRPGEIAVELGVEMEEGLLQRSEPGDPHPGRRERVHPGDDADAAR
jgi:hypothetical protein